MKQNRLCILLLYCIFSLLLTVLCGCGKSSTSERLATKKLPPAVSFYHYNVRKTSPTVADAQHKINPMYSFPGSFCPPTIGHLFVVKKAAAFLPHVTIVCSVNPHKKDPWFSPEKCKELWLSYSLPTNVNVVTLAQIAKNINGPEIVMIRGIRDAKDWEEEKKVVQLNAEKYNISKFLYILHNKPNEHPVSSTKIRALAQDLNIEELSKHVSPMVISALLEKVLHIKNLFMVVGKTGAGKSTFLKMLQDEDSKNVFINTDELNHELRPLLQAHFKGENLIDVALNKEEEMLKVITHPWLKLLTERLKKVPSDTNVFLEIAYGMEPIKSLFRFVGGKIIYIGCEEITTNIERNKLRGTPHLKAFIDRIPDLEETKKIAEQHKLELISINTDCSLNDVRQLAKSFNDWLKTKQ